MCMGKRGKQFAGLDRTSQRRLGGNLLRDLTADKRNSAASPCIGPKVFKEDLGQFPFIVSSDTGLTGAAVTPPVSMRGGAAAFLAADCPVRRLNAAY